MRHALLALALFAAGVLLAAHQRSGEEYAPIARVRSADGLFITLVQPKTTRRSDCAVSLERFESALARSCPRCTLESAECGTRLEGIDRLLAGGERVPIFTIAAGGIRVGLVGPPGRVEAECRAMAGQFVRSGVGAACVNPGSS